MTQSVDVLYSSGKVQSAVCVQPKCEPPQREAQGESREKESSHRLTSRPWVISSAPHQRRKHSAAGQHVVASWSPVLITACLSSHMVKAVFLHTGQHYSGASYCVCVLVLSFCQHTSLSPPHEVKRKKKTFPGSSVVCLPGLLSARLKVRGSVCQRGCVGSCKRYRIEFVLSVW